MRCGFGYAESEPAEADFQGILYSREGRIHEFPTERIRLPGFASEGSWNFTITDGRMIYLMTAVVGNDAPGGGVCCRDVATGVTAEWQQ